MQKKLIALAIAGLASTAAFAQTNVTIYGVADVYGSYQSANNTTGDQTRTAINSGGLSGSRIGFKGTEGLGNGLTAAFVYELNIDPTVGDGGTSGLNANQTSNGITTTRQSYVALVGGFGTVAAGRLQSLGYDFGVKYDALGGSSAFSSLAHSTNQMGMSITGSGNLGRQNNTVAYISPNFSGFTVKTHYTFGEQTTGTNLPFAGYDKAGNVWALGADYDNGPFSIGVAYHDINNIGGQTNAINAPAIDQTEWALGLKYDFKVVNVFATYQEAKTDYDITGLNDYKRSAYSLGAAIPVGSVGSVKLSWTGSGKDADANVYGIDYEHGLSKRTTAYVGYNYVDNGNDSRFAASGASGVNASFGDSAWTLGAGVRHTF